MKRFSFDFTSKTDSKNRAELIIKALAFLDLGGKKVYITVF
jgi:hypothetical protein